MKSAELILVCLCLLHTLGKATASEDFARSVDPLPEDSAVTHPYLCDGRGSHCLPGKPYFEAEIHTGIDIVSPHGESTFSNRVVASLPGRIHTLISDVTCSGPDCESAGNRVAIEHLLDDGSRVFTHYAHMLHLVGDRSPTPLGPGDFVPAGSVIGYQGRTGSSTGFHLHFEVSAWSEMSLTYECLPHWLPACRGDRRPPDPTGSRLLRDPAPFRDGERRALIPVIAQEEPQPEEANRDVYGRADRDLCASLELESEVDRSYEEIGVRALPSVGGAGGAAEGLFSRPSVRLHAGMGQRLSGCSRLAPGDYHFAATSRDFGSGYPVKLTVLGDPDSVIVDNDQRNEGSYSYSEQLGDGSGGWNVVPGYYRSARLARTRSNARASWTPGRPGPYRIWVHVPKGASAREVRYAIRSQVSDVPIASAPIDHSAADGGWILLTADDGRDVFELSPSGRVDLVLARDGPPLRNAQLPYEGWVAFDAVKFEAAGSADAHPAAHPLDFDARDPDHEVRGQLDP